MAAVPEKRDARELSEEASLLERLAKTKVSSIVQLILRSPHSEYRYRFEQALDKLHIEYMTTPPGFAREIIMGSYALMADKYQHNFGKPFENSLHVRIQQDIRDRRIITNFKKKNGNDKLYSSKGYQNNSYSTEHLTEDK